MSSGWVVMVGWEKFQHYRDRDPSWIKVYLDLLRRDEFMDLTPTRQAMLFKLWILYATKRRLVADNTAVISRELGQRVTSRDLKALQKAGFIHLSASKPLADRYQVASPEKEKEVKGLRAYVPPRTRAASERTNGTPHERTPLTEQERHDRALTWARGTGSLIPTEEVFLDAAKRIDPDLVPAMLELWRGQHEPEPADADRDIALP